MTFRYLTFDDRKKLENLYIHGEDLCTIANHIGVHLATIYRELMRGYTGELDINGRNGYSADIAQKTILTNLKHRGRKK